MKTYTVIKRNPKGEETWRYQGQLVQHADRVLIIEAFFDREDIDLHGLFIGHGDRFIETYYTDRWYNIFEIRDHRTNHLRGWYANITTPAQISEGTIEYIDLALDLVVLPDGKQIILDEDEFIDLEISDEMRAVARQALAELQGLFTNGRFRTV